MLGRLAGLQVTAPVIVVPFGCDLPNRRLIARTLPAGLTAVTHGIETWLVMPVVVTAAEHEAVLHPDQLRPDGKPAGFQALGNGAGMNAGVPDVGDVARKQ